MQTGVLDTEMNFLPNRGGSTMYAGRGYCDVYADTEDTLTVPELNWSAQQLSNLRGCLEDGYYDINGVRACEKHRTVVEDLELMRGHQVTVDIIA